MASNLTSYLFTKSAEILARSRNRIQLKKLAGLRKWGLAGSMFTDSRILDHLSYQSCYCEENVYKLAEKFDQCGYCGHVIFVTSVSQHTPVWFQKSSRSANDPVVWDYHVFYLLTQHAIQNEEEEHRNQITETTTPVGVTTSPSASISPVLPIASTSATIGTTTAAMAVTSLVFDQDSTLPFPCPATDYVKHAFQFGKLVLPPENELRFRVVDAKKFLRYFSSDRRHMKIGHHSGAREYHWEWMAEPPPWPLIQGEPVESSKSVVQTKEKNNNKSKNKNKDDDRDKERDRDKGAKVTVFESTNINNNGNGSNSAAENNSISSQQQQQLQLQLQQLSTRHNLPAYLCVDTITSLATPINSHVNSNNSNNSSTSSNNSSSDGTTRLNNNPHNPIGAVMSLNQLYKFIIMCNKCQ